jgi:hypothetical protein
MTTGTIAIRRTCAEPVPSHSTVSGTSLVIYKKARTDTTSTAPNIMTSPEVEHQLDELQQLHARRFDNGYQRQPRKIRASKQTTTSTRSPKSDATALATIAVDVDEV